MKKFKDYIVERIEKENPNWVNVDFKPHTKYSSAHGLNGPIDPSNTKSLIMAIDGNLSNPEVALDGLKQLMSHNLTRTLRENVKQLMNLLRMAESGQDTWEDIQKMWGRIVTVLNTVYVQKQV